MKRSCSSGPRKMSHCWAMIKDGSSWITCVSITVTRIKYFSFWHCLKCCVSYPVLMRFPLFLYTSYGISPENIILYGQSIGTVPTVDLASRYECAAVVLHSPLTSGMRVAFPDTKKTYCFDAFPKWVFVSASNSWTLNSYCYSNKYELEVALKRRDSLHLPPKTSEQGVVQRRCAHSSHRQVGCSFIMQHYAKW